MSPGLTAWPLGMFSVDGTTAVIVTGSPSSAIAGHRLDHRGAARHVELHLLHLRRGLDRDPAGVEGHGLADEAEVRPARVRRAGSAARSAAAPRRLPWATAANAPMPRATIASRSSSSTSSASCSVGDLGGALGEEARRGHVGREVLEVARGVGGRRPPRGRARPRRRPPPRRPARATRCRRRVVVADFDLKRSNAYSFRSVPSTSAAADALAARGAAHDSDTAPELLGPRRRGGGGHARPLGVELLALSEPGDQHAALAAARRVLVGDGHLLRGRPSPRPGRPAAGARGRPATRPRTSRPHGCPPRSPRGLPERAVTVIGAISGGLGAHRPRLQPRALEVSRRPRGTLARG